MVRPWRWAGRILRDAAHLLMEGTPPDINIAEVSSELQKLDGVRDTHHVHAWALTSGRYVFSAHLRIHDSADSERVLNDVHEILKKTFGFFFATLQLETNCLDELHAAAIDVQPVSNGE